MSKTQMFKMVCIKIHSRCWGSFK